MDREKFDPIAKHLIAGVLDAVIYSRRFNDEHGSPPTLMSKVHHIRSVIQAAMSQDPALKLHAQYSEYGRVAYTDLETGEQFALRGMGALRIDKAKYVQLELALGELASIPSDVQLIVYRFVRDGVHLSVAKSAQVVGRRRLEPVGEPAYIGLWLFVPDGDDPQRSFDQEVDNPFDFLGQIGDLEDGEAGAGA